MADLGPLIRLQRFTLDERRRVIARLYADADRVLLRKTAMLSAVQTERTFASESLDPHVITQFLSYQGLMKKKVALVDSELARIEARIDVATEDLRDQFAELKRYEITQRQRLERQKQEMRKREMAMFDDIAIDSFRRAQEQTSE